MIRHLSTNALGPILLVSGHPLNWHSGASSLFLNLERSLRNAGVEVSCLHGGDINSKGGIALSKIRMPALVVKNLRSRLSRFKVVDIAGSIACTLFEQLSKEPKVSRPLLVNRLHGLEFKDEQARVTEEIARQIRLPWKYKNITRHLVNAREKRAIRAADVVVCSSSRDADAIVAAGWKTRDRIEVMAPGVVPEFFSPERDYLGGERLLWWGSWVERKGVNYLAETFDLALREVPTLQLTIGGSGKEPEFVLRHFSPASRARVQVLGFVSAEVHLQELRSHDIFLFPSISEGFGLALVEAMASGLPPITTMTGLAHDWLEHGESCMLVPMAAPTATARVIVRLATDPGLRARIGRKAQQVARQLTWDKLADNSLAAYARGLERLRSSTATS